MENCQRSYSELWWPVLAWRSWQLLFLAFKHYKVKIMAKTNFVFRKKAKQLAQLQSERYSGSSTHLLLEASEAGNLSIREGVGKTSLGRDANYTKMILELLTDSLHFRAIPCEGCLRGQMLQLLPVTYFVFVCVKILIYTLMAKHGIFVMSKHQQILCWILLLKIYLS